MMQIMSMDKVCAERAIQTRKDMLVRTDQDQGKGFTNLEEYAEYRMVDSGAE